LVCSTARDRFQASEGGDPSVTPKIRRAIVAVTLATTAVVGGVGVGHALAASKSSTTSNGANSNGSATDTTKRSSGNSSQTHHCPNDDSSNSNSSTSN
jgi:hypothetical protein